MENQTFRVAVVAFCESTGIDESEAGALAALALGRQLGPRPAALQPYVTPSGTKLPPVTVHKVMEVGAAAGNGYLWTAPTGKAYPDREEPDLAVGEGAERPKLSEIESLHAPLLALAEAARRSITAVVAERPAREVDLYNALVDLENARTALRPRDDSE